MWRAWALLALTAGGAYAGAETNRAVLLACADLLRPEAQGATGAQRDQLLADAALHEKAVQGFDGRFAGLAGLAPMPTAPVTVSECQPIRPEKP